MSVNSTQYLRICGGVDYVIWSSLHFVILYLCIQLKGLPFSLWCIYLNSQELVRRQQLMGHIQDVGGKPYQSSPRVPALPNKINASGHVTGKLSSEVTTTLGSTLRWTHGELEVFPRLLEC